MNVITNIGLPTAARERAEAEQRQASDPAVSAFVAASAGSGKTKLLTDRMLRLMLAGADPARRPLPLETSIPGVFAIGDVRCGSTKRVAAAVGEGAAVVAQLHSALAAP